MKRTLSTIVVLLLSGLAFATNPLYVQEQKTTHYLYSKAAIEPGMWCSATAIGKHAVLTASHCEAPTDSLLVDRVYVTVVDRLRDGADHTILLLKGIEFKDVATVVQRDLEIGEEFFLFGNPGRYINLFRKGVLAGSWNDPKEVPPRKVYIVDLNGYQGDSGAALFDSCGVVVGIISLRLSEEGETPMIMMGALPLQFSVEQMLRAKEF